jgi:hypothetical protein
MNDLTERLAELAAISDADAARLVSHRTGADLAARITAVPPDSPGQDQGLIPASLAAGAAGARARRRWLAGLPLVAAAAATILVVAVGIQPDRPGGHNPPGHAAARVLAFIRHGGYIDVIVRNPTADPRRYRAEFRAHGLDISLRLVPASPSIVGTVVYLEGNSSLKVITAHGRCFTGGGGETCPVGIQVPVHYRGRAELVFGRPARPGERYETTVPATARGEALHGLRIDGQRVRTVLRLIRTRHETATAFHITNWRGLGKIVRHVPPSWFVYEADPRAPGQVMLWAGPTRQPQPVSTPQPGNPAPTSTPAPGTPSPSRTLATLAPPG